MLPPVAAVPASFAPRRPAHYPPHYLAAPHHPHQYQYQYLHPHRCLPYPAPYPLVMVPAPAVLPSLRTKQPVIALPPPYMALPALKEEERKADRSPTGSAGGWSPSSSASGTPTSHKGALAFILSSDADASSAPGHRPTASRATGKKRPSPTAADASAPAPAKKKSKKGSKFCAVEGCASRAKHARRCWKHGGSVKCKVADCANRAKSKGVCWSHGGGTVCAFNDCETISVSNGFCWAHGGGKRCTVAGCSKPAYERTRNLCSAHYREDKGKDKDKDKQQGAAA